MGARGFLIARTTAIITPRIQNITSNHRRKLERHVGHFQAKEAQHKHEKPREKSWTQLPGRTPSSGCRRTQEQPPLGKGARPNQRGRNMGLARGVADPSLRLFS